MTNVFSLASVAREPVAPSRANTVVRMHVTEVFRCELRVANFSPNLLAVRDARDEAAAAAQRKCVAIVEPLNECYASQIDQQGAFDTQKPERRQRYSELLERIARKVTLSVGVSDHVVTLRLHAFNARSVDEVQALRLLEKELRR